MSTPYDGHFWIEETTRRKKNVSWLGLHCRLSTTCRLKFNREKSRKESWSTLYCVIYYIACQEIVEILHRLLSPFKIFKYTENCLSALPTEDASKMSVSPIIRNAFHLEEPSSAFSSISNSSSPSFQMQSRGDFSSSLTQSRDQGLSSSCSSLSSNTSNISMESNAMCKNFF